MSTDENIRQDQAAAELTAWQTGGDLVRADKSLTGTLLMARGLLPHILSAEEAGALDTIGHDRWAFWVRQGYEDVRQIRRPGLDRGIEL